MAQETYNKAVSQPSTGLSTDNNPIDQPKGTYRFALNAVNERVSGDQGKLSNELGNQACTTIPEGFSIIGDRYTEEDSTVVILVNPETGKEQIGTIDKDGIYRTHIDTSVLGLKITNQCDIIYRLRRGKERVIYWTDGLNKARTFNLNRPYNFYNQTYQSYLRAGGNPDTFAGEKWDAASFDLIKSYKSIPFFSNVEILETGSITPGSYNFAVQYVDEDLNPTEWINTSNTVRIYNDSTNNPYPRIRGSRNISTDAQNFSKASKTIKLTMSNLDDSFPYYRIGIIRAAGNTGKPEKVLLSDLFSTRESIFLYTGNDGALQEGSLAEILVDNEVIFAPQHIEQIENRLILANTKGKGINWCEFQKFTSKVSTDLVTKEVILNNVLSEPNVKNAKSTFIYRGYMPGEVYSFGLVYIFSDGTLSPVFHIPGISSTNNTSLMKHYELTTKYLDVHNCSTNSYWGNDSQNVSLTGKNVRHHRFPFRKDVNKPLVTKVSSPITTNKYRLKVNITLNPAWTPGPIEFPNSGTPDFTPLIIDYDFKYQVGTSPGQDTYSGQLTDTDIGTDIILYNDVTELTELTPGVYSSLDSGSSLFTYQGGGNDRFIITETYESYVVDSSIDNDVSEIFGIKFSNIERPHPDVIGFYVVRNERTDDDKLIVDNSIIGTMTEFDQYKSFGLVMPKQYYTANNCGNVGNSGKILKYSKNSVWFLNPEYQFFNKRVEFDNFEIEGKYEETSVNMPTISNVDGSSCNRGKSKGVYIDDVQAGTSYNPDINKKKDKDDDGFDLLLGYRNTNSSYSIEDSITFPEKERILHLNAASYQNFDAKTYYNVSVDNKIGMFLTPADDFDTEWFYNSATKKNSLLYGSLVRNSNSLYSNFISRPYYKEHNNPILFGSNNTINNIEIYNGDAEISSMNFVSSVFYDMVVADRAKKNKVWKIVLGAVLVVAGVIAGIFTAGAGLTISAVGIATLSALAISYGVSLAISGIKFEQFKSMVDVDYEKGLKDTVVDGGVYETVRDTIEKDDDTIRWFSDRVSNIYIESSVAFGVRTGLTCGVTDFIDSPGAYNEAGFRNYLTEKFTVLDRDQGSGRMYKGYPTAEFYDMNLDYLRFNKEKQFSHLPLEYDCCSDSNEIFPLRRWFSEQSFQEEKVDNYRVFLPNNYSDMEGEHGEITDIYRLANNLFINTKEGLWQQPANLQERVTNEIVSFIGTGDFLAIPPRKVIDDTLGSGGTQHKWATIKTKNGVFFINEIEGNIYLHNETIKNISLIGERNWFENNLTPHLSKQLFDKYGVDFLHKNNPANPNGIGYLSTYDTRFERIILTKKDYRLLNDKLILLKVVANKELAGDEFIYSLEDGNFYENQTLIALEDSRYFENRSWTKSFSFHTNSWVSYHSYLPNYYIHSQNYLYSFVSGNNSIWKHNIHGLHNHFYGNSYPFMVEYVDVSEPLSEKTTESLILQTEAKRWVEDLQNYVDEQMITFNKIQAYNTRQNTGELNMVPKDETSMGVNWLFNQVANNVGEIFISRRNRDWSINELRDYVVDYKTPMFTSRWLDIKMEYPIDKLTNPSAVSHLKKWDELEILRDKFIVIRLKFDNFNHISLSLHYSIRTEQVSE